ncbi:PREDICTED: CDP-diacylglycerol--inositol 3-phosphatidyltransferase-like [Acropora digitifera]|uniref:CDP-diacylglycerol--inositol 3-phosphatidyltransferase-like n=1 Tax=Acropora digitifera TaxID=70779 RepID=UPI00077B1713|nr:PREDICTED: CDP-diacylglycerol--inositol 3-phosphatidyltransferase-like [Acropora digitifera]XP_015769208.1 PREDICTED: CDP-diacylglycerol--inositol 3-phosphatidyltransferase-like [Acropora digitifera]XP_029194362.1 CDP-diacylglycerol--inositol 3-phosphatidyltransferase-like [Acropora millepora]XP_029194363.1 CDP-diacylglycerol--inositol 3-phosphatidyltransferase-like [Acropora millepora]XP_029194364.1 CDP-diacylglycerol--inositol 3-phosphatidyltransferase-like [Acropora millepora]
MKENVFLFIPNLIGYARIVLAISSFYFMPTDYVLTTITYLTSGLLDAFDGYAARYFNQSTMFGAMLDMLTDRCVTTALQVMLALFYPNYTFVFQILICLDISSHWIHVQSSLLKGGASHKKIDLSGNFFLRIYYHSRIVLFLMCAGNELFFCMLYLIHFTSGPLVSVGNISFGLWVAMAWLTLPICIVKQVISVIQLIVACINTANLDESEREKINK